MKIKITETFKKKLNSQVHYIAKDKPEAARKFINDLFVKLNQIPQMPFSNRKSIFFDDKNIRDLIFKGYVIVYRINEKEDQIEVFGFTKYEEHLFE